MSGDLHAHLTAYLAAHFGADVKIENLSRIPGGASRETYRFDAVSQDSRRGLILRRDPVSTLIDTDRSLEFLAYQSFHPRGIPTPAPLILDEEGGVLERPFFIMGRVDGGTAANPFSVAPYAPYARAIGQSLFTILGQIAAADPATLPLARAAAIPPASQCWSIELSKWEAILDRDELHPQPLARAGIRRLRAAPPPPAQKIATVHGDYRSGNFLHDGAGRILAILDWEMVHFGDPLEDLAWSFDPLWGHFEPDCVAGLIPRADAIAAWQAASGLQCNPRALEWWELFNAVKGLVIWMSAAKAFRDGGGGDPVLALSGWYCARRHDEIIADHLLRGMTQGAVA